MPKRYLNQTVVLHRKGARVELPAGETHELSADEIEDIVAVSPDALSTTATVDLSESDKPVAQLTAAEKKAAAAAAAPKAVAGPVTSGSEL